MFTGHSLFLRFFLDNYGRLLLILGAGLISSALGILIPISLGKYYDLLLGYSSYRAEILDLLPTSWTDTVPHFLLFFGMMILLRLGTEFLERYQTGLIGEQFIFYLRKLLFHSQMHIPLPVYEEKGTGRYLLRWSGDLKSLQRLISHGMIRFFRDLVFVGGMLWVLFHIHEGLCFLVGLILSLAIGGIRLLNRILFQASVLTRNRKSGLLSFMNQRLRAIATIQALNRERVEAKKLEKKAARVLEAGQSYQQIYSLIYTFASASIYVLFFGLMLWGQWAHDHLQSSFDPTSLFITFLFMISLAPVLRRMFRVPVHWEMARISLSKLLAVMNLQPMGGRKETYQFLEGEIVLSLPGAKFILIPAKQTTLIKDTDGTLIHQLTGQILGLYPTEEGEIWIDQQDISLLDKKSLRKRISPASIQHPLLGRTVFEAISYSRKADKREAAQNMLDHFQANMPVDCQLDLDDPIGELGNRLSPIQQKILLFTRACLSQKPILLLGKPFDNLALPVSRQLIAKLNELHGVRTILILGDSPITDDVKIDQMICSESIHN